MAPPTAPIRIQPDPSACSSRSGVTGHTRVSSSAGTRSRAPAKTPIANSHQRGNARRRTRWRTSEAAWGTPSRIGASASESEGANTATANAATACADSIKGTRVSRRTHARRNQGERLSTGRRVRRPKRRKRSIRSNAPPVRRASVARASVIMEPAGSAFFPRPAPDRRGPASPRAGSVPCRHRRSNPTLCEWGWSRRPPRCRCRRCRRCPRCRRYRRCPRSRPDRHPPHPRSGRGCKRRS